MYAPMHVDDKNLFLTNRRGYILDCEKVGTSHLFTKKDFVLAQWHMRYKIPSVEPLQYIQGLLGGAHEASSFLTSKNGHWG
jgi:hypothetical protein